jgi:methylmalonyl-CoA mutase N-terminal domain/subunit
MEQAAYDYFEKIERFGGVIPALKAGFMQREIADAAYRYQSEIDRRERIVVGVNDFISQDELLPAIHKIEPESERRHLERLERVRVERDNAAVEAKLSALGAAARRERDNLMPYLMDAARAYATLGEMTDVLREAWGAYRELLAV